MQKERSLGVTETRFALTLLTCLLVAIGYVALLRLAGTKETSADIGPNDVSPPTIVGPALPIEPQPIVLPLEPGEGRNDSLAKRPSSSDPSIQSK